MNNLMNNLAVSKRANNLVETLFFRSKLRGISTHIVEFKQTKIRTTGFPIYFLLFLVILFGACSNNGMQTDAYGNFEADETLVSSETNGKLMQFTVTEGDIIKAGTIVGLVDTIMPALQIEEITAQQARIYTALKSIDAQIDILKQQKENLDIDLARIKNMTESGAATQKQLDDITGAIKVIEKQITANFTQQATTKAELGVLSAKMLLINEQLNKCRIINPINGSVIEKYAEPGEITAAGKPLYKIANLEKIILRAYVSGGQLNQVTLGQVCKVRIDKSKKEYKEYAGKIIWIAQQAEFTPKIIQTKEERVNMVYAIKIEVVNDGVIKMGMPGEVTFNQD